MSPAGGGARAALALALALAAGALTPPPRSAPCAAPGGEREAAEGRTLEVACGGSGGELRGPARLLFGRGVDPNRADLATLEALPGVGPGRAAGIAEARREAPFCGLGDLDRVKGIGPGTLQAMAPWLVFAPLPDCGEVR
jgi:hypothetical protein